VAYISKKSIGGCYEAAGSSANPSFCVLHAVSIATLTLLPQLTTSQWVSRRRKRAPGGRTSTPASSSLMRKVVGRSAHT
jgi:hypothetical protein